MTRALPIFVLLAVIFAVAVAAAFAFHDGRDQVCISAATYQDGRESQSGVECRDR